MKTDDVYIKVRDCKVPGIWGEMEMIFVRKMGKIGKEVQNSSFSEAKDLRKSRS